MSEELGFLQAVLQEHWGKLVTGLGVMFGFSYKTGIEKTKYEGLVVQVAEHGERLKNLDGVCDERYHLLSTMNANLQLLMHHLDVKPIESLEKRRKTGYEENEIS